MAFHTLKEVKTLFRILNVKMNDEMPVLDALDKCCCEVAKLSASMMPLPGKIFFMAASARRSFLSLAFAFFGLSGRFTYLINGH